MANAIGKTVRRHREWLARNGARILERDRNYLLADIEECTPVAFRQIPDSLRGISTYFGILGAIKVIDGDESGWEDLSTAIDFHGWELKLRAHSFFRVWSGFGLTNHVSRAACLVCVSDKWGAIAQSVLLEADADQEPVDQAYWSSRRFEPFVLDCGRLRVGNAPVSRSLKPPYASVFQSWDDDRALARALDDVCAYHCANIDDLGGDWDPEFKHAPFDLLPCEVMLVRRIRRELGLSVPEVSHELVTLLSPPDAIGPEGQEHELLTAVADAFDRCFS